MKHLIIAIILNLGLLGNSQAAIDTREFVDNNQRQRYHDLTSILRCPKCQNQNIAESSSPIASDLRGEIYRMLGAGQSDKQIIDFMVSRYGDFVLYDPPLSSRTALLWLGPATLLLTGGVAITTIVANRRRRRVAGNILSDTEQRRLADLLQKTNLPIERDS